jgi:hypothetical protein
MEDRKASWSSLGCFDMMMVMVRLVMERELVMGRELL